MKINRNFVLRKIRNEYFLVPYRKNNISSDVIFLNNTCGVIFENAEKCIDKNILAEYVAEYFNVNNDADAKEQINEFIEYTINIGLIK